MTPLASEVTLQVVASPTIVMLMTRGVLYAPIEHLYYSGLYYKTFRIVIYDRNPSYG
jgi:hypothetical protein